VIGGRNASSYALFKKSDTYGYAIWRSPVYNLGKNFDILSIKFAVVGGITGAKEIVPTLYFDNEYTNSIGTAITANNYTNEETLILLTSKNFTNSVSGRHNFFLELQFTGTDLCVVKLPITLEIEVHEN